MEFTSSATVDICEIKKLWEKIEPGNRRNLNLSKEVNEGTIWEIELNSPEVYSSAMEDICEIEKLQKKLNSKMQASMQANKLRNSVGFTRGVQLCHCRNIYNYLSKLLNITLWYSTR